MGERRETNQSVRRLKLRQIQRWSTWGLFEFQLFFEISEIILV